MNTFQKLSVAASTVILTLSVSTGSASAAGLTWTLNDVTFRDGGTATGSFTYDADTNTYSNISILTTVFEVLPVTDYNQGSLLSGNPDTLDLANGGIAPPPNMPLFTNNILSLKFASSLTNNGGTVNINGTEQFNSFFILTSSARSIVGGYVRATPVAVPVPGAVFGVIVAGSALVARQRKNAKAKQTVA